MIIWTLSFVLTYAVSEKSPQAGVLWAELSAFIPGWLSSESALAALTMFRASSQAAPKPHAHRYNLWWFGLVYNLACGGSVQGLQGKDLL